MTPFARNHAWWEERAALHEDTPLYREMLEKLEAGGDTLLPFDDAVLGDIRGVDVVHLQCHLGTETLSLARRGARVTGVDYSETAVNRARALARRLAVDARFVHSSVQELDRTLDETFDLVYTSYGVLLWLDDLTRWAQVVAHLLRPGGRLILIDTHPLAMSLADDHVSDPLRVRFPYLAGKTPLRFDAAGSYAARDAHTTHNVTYEWPHGLGEIVQSVLDAGLRLTVLTEHPEIFFPAWPELVPTRPGLWRLPDSLHGQYPLTFTLVAVKPPAAGQNR